MKPIPESREAVEEYGPFVDRDLLGELEERADRVRELVPQCVGLSLTVLTQDVVVTLVATPDEVAAIPAVPEVPDGAVPVEGRAIMSTLTMPVQRDGRVVARLHLYAAVPAAFDGHHEALAHVFGVTAPGAITDADLSFSTMAEARQVPANQRAGVTLHRAAALLGASKGIDHAAAGRRLRDSARRADVPLGRLAELVVEVLSER